MVLQPVAVGKIAEGVMSAMQQFSGGAGGKGVPVPIVQCNESRFQGCGIPAVQRFVARIGDDKPVENGIDHQRGVGKIEPDMRVHAGMIMMMVMVRIMTVIMLVLCDTGAVGNPLPGIDDPQRLAV